MHILVRGVDQYSWTLWGAVDRNQDCWTADMTVLLLKTLTQKMLVYDVNYVSTTMKGTKVQTLRVFLLCIQKKYHSLH